MALVACSHIVIFRYMPADLATTITKKKPANCCFQDISVLGKRGIADLMAAWITVAELWDAAPALPWARAALDAHVLLRAAGDHVQAILDGGAFAPRRLMQSAPVRGDGPVAAEALRVAAAARALLAAPPAYGAALQGLNEAAMGAAWEAVKFRMPVRGTTGDARKSHVNDCAMAHLYYLYMLCSIYIHTHI